jgi:hypothetical protein
MEMISVSSSNIAAIGYDFEMAILRIQFLQSGTYDYQQVPQHVYEGMLSALSKGRYFDQYIKSGHYQYTKVD